MNGPKDVSKFSDVSKLSDVSTLVDALRDDVPSEQDRERMRNRLISAGVLAAGTGTAAATAGTAQALAQGSINQSAVQLTVAKVGLLGKLAAVPAAAKLTIAAATVAGGLLISDLSPTDNSAPDSATAAPSHRDARPPSISPGPVPSARKAAIPEQIYPTVQSASPPHPARLEKIVSKRRAPRVAVKPAAKPAKPAKPAESLATSLKAEAQLLERAVEALHQRDLSTARDLLQSHRTRYPGGLLAQEREQTWAHLTNLQTQLTPLK